MEVSVSTMLKRKRNARLEEMISPPALVSRVYLHQRGLANGRFLMLLTQEKAEGSAGVGDITTDSSFKSASTQ